MHAAKTREATVRKRADRPEPLSVQALYTLAQLVRFTRNTSIHALRRVLRANGVVFVRAGRTIYVPLSEIEKKIPALWESLKAVAVLNSVD